ncbi:MAG: D-arabinose 5-phosphate isomerase [Bacteroidetes bacterium HGW-Bacteroidetes-1]|nr:MAG: D-arabinose 5-phosphate isomerase [Bacteroidetes bacterium HGW-Bacteroidetes-1]
MKTNEEIKHIGKQVVENERDAIAGLGNSINETFAQVVQLIYLGKGSVIVSGIGKSAIIAQKIVATLNSTGTTAVFMHAADAIHGDLGIIRPEDIIILLSKSGETPEIKLLMPLLKSRGNRMIAIVGNVNSYLAQQTDFVLDVSVPKEACPNNLAPTASTTAQLVMGDALAVSLLECRGFSAADFARFHPGGALGKQLYLRVDDVYQKNDKPAVQPFDDLRKVIVEISTKRLGATAVLDGTKLIGIITDGDLRRMLMENTRIDLVKAMDIMTKTPKCIESTELVVDALSIMRQHNITQLPVMQEGFYKGVIHLHDILREGIL